MIAEKPPKLVAVALANKMARDHLGAVGQEGMLPGTGGDCRCWGIAAWKRVAVRNWNTGLRGCLFEAVMRG